MNFKFDHVYYSTQEDGLLNIFFEDLNNATILYFDGGRFSIVVKNFKEESCKSLNIEKGIITGIKENDDMDYLLKINKDIIMKIFFFPNDSFLNGVQQILEIYTIKDKFYPQLLLDLNTSEEAIIY